MSAHATQWVTASPLWHQALHGAADDAESGRLMRSPALLRFERDSFMEDVARLLERDPARLEAHVAQPASYRLPAPGEKEPPAPDLLKLFQAAHGHFHLVAATLVCRLPGLPEREVQTAAQERVGFVIRRADPDGGEWAWCADEAGEKGRAWLRLDDPSALDGEEDVLPLFPLRYSDGDRTRRLFVGLVPTSSGETFKAAGALSPLAEPGDGAGAPPEDPRPLALRTRVTDPLRALMAAPLHAPAEVTDAVRRAQIETAQREQLVEASRFLLLDFAEFLVTSAPGVWAALSSGSRPGGAAGVLFDELTARAADTGRAMSWREALVRAWNERLVLFGDAEGASSLHLNLRSPGLTPDGLDQLVVAALPALDPAAAAAGAVSVQGETAAPPEVPKYDARGSSVYVLRCVYSRPRCAPDHRHVLSEPSARFRIAGFFDLDAPSRPIHISLPIDTGIKDLRKLRKNVNFLLSDQLRQQMNRVSSLKDALNGQFASGTTFDIGLLCSFSIPIITICALLVLMIFIQLLNIIFWWLPFLRICFPIGLSAKK